MRAHLIGKKTKFAIEIRILDDCEVLSLSENVIYWEKCSHGQIGIYVNNKRFGNQSTWYPIEPTVEQAILDSISVINCSALFELAPDALFHAFWQADETSPDYDISDAHTEEEVSKVIENIIEFTSKSTTADTICFKFNSEYLRNSELSDSRNMIGVFAFQELDTIVFTNKSGTLYFAIYDEKRSLFEKIVISEVEYRQIWCEARRAIS